MEEYLQTPLPMVNDSNLKSFVGKYVIVHGRVNSVKNNSLFLQINPDNNTDLIVKNFNQAVKQGGVIKIIGKVFPDLSLEFLQCYQMQDDFDLKLLNEMIPIINHPEVSIMFSNSNN